MKILKTFWPKCFQYLLIFPSVGAVELRNSIIKYGKILPEMSLKLLLMKSFTYAYNEKVQEVNY